MSKKFRLQIPEPCHESWDKMSPVEQGRFCDSCEKAVVDFTGMSDAQLIAFFKKPPTGSVCGRFNDDQLQRDIVIRGKRMPWLRYLLQFIIPVFLSSLKTYSQGKPVIKETVTSSVCTNPKSDQRIVLGNSLPSINKELIGKVADDKGIGIPYASVMIKETTYGVSCDSAGNFYLKIPNGIKKLTLIASSVGYSQVEKEINARKDKSLEIKLKKDSYLNDEVVVTGFVGGRKGMVTMGAMTTARKRSSLQKVKELFVGDSVNVFPNSAKAGNNITIEWKEPVKGEFSIDLYNLQGQLIKSSLIKTDHETNSMNFGIPQITTGAYVLKLRNNRSGRNHAVKIIIQ